MLKQIRSVLGLWLTVAYGCAVLVSVAGAQTALAPTGDVLHASGKGYIVTIRPGAGNKIIEGFDVKQGHKIRLAGFGLTNAEVLRRIMRQVEGNVAIELPGSQRLWILKSSVADLSADTFQLELDRTGLVVTFADEFETFSWDSEGAPGTWGERGTWRTNYGHAAPGAQVSRTLDNNKELEIYSDPGFRGTALKPLGINPFRVVNGVLEIVAEPAPENIRRYMWDFQYTSGLITTRRSFSQTYGVFEMRARVPSGRGLWPAFWLVPADGSWPPELDFEVLGHDTTTLYTGWHSKGTGEHTSDTLAVRVPDVSADFHNYAFEWDKNEIRWYFDGVEVMRKATPSDMHKPMHVRANLAVGGSWPKSPDSSTQFPAVFAIDWIHVYRRETNR